MNKAEQIIKQIKGASDTVQVSTIKIVESENNPFEKLKFEIGEKDYNKVAVAYVDEEVHQAFKYLKDNFSLNVGDLFSYLGEKFLNEHQEEIKSLIKKNKFI
tara:strand:+ start:29944 stop:30249 length:306 start_codon:yes stop_codon:yes gene_type:complete